MINYNKLKRDHYNQAVLNSDIDSYHIHLRDTKKSREIVQTIQDVKKLKEDITEIKDMLRLLLNGNNHG